MSRESSDDEAPHVVSKVAAKEEALAQRRVEKNAIRSNNKRKRISRKRLESKSDEQERNNDTAQPTTLPDDVIKALANHEDQAQNEQEPSVPIKVVHKQDKVKKIRQFGSIRVEKLSHSTTPNYQISAAALAFSKQKMAPCRRRMNLIRGHDAYFRKY
ncbi:unnamed protein product [Albugo candida]|uniref:Uncharacterized protein n=1 Tax=Albugo candida TaxID=65357 RepID=A0A024GNR2_9STRA|nr:unnamed protein product [Albugo candida]|eukprot:CCI48524.1 unnamed protein product [Albugo candida]